MIADSPAPAAPADIQTVPPVQAPVQPAPDVTLESSVKGADGLKDAISSQNNTLGDFVQVLDNLALELGDTRFSIWDALVVVIVIAGVITLAYLGGRLARGVLKRISPLDLTQRLLADKLISLAVWTFAVLIGIDVLGIDLTALAVFSGAFGLAIGFGLQKTFGNLIAGIILLMDRSIKPGDVIAVSDQAGNSTFGQIRKIGIRAVSVTTRDQREYLIPNENLMVNQVENWSYSSRQVRMQVPVGVSYNCDLNLAEELMLEAANKVDRVLGTPAPSVWLEAYGDNSVNFLVHCWITDPEEGVGNVRSEVLKNLWWLFKERGIEIPFPQRDLNIRNNEQLEQLISAIAQRTEGKNQNDD